MDKKQLLMIAAGGAAATVIGVLLPWWSVDVPKGLGPLAAAFDTSVSGLDSGGGKFVLLLGLVAAAAAGALFLGKTLPVPGKTAILVSGACLGLAALICLMKFLDIKGPVSTGIGLWLCLIGSIAGAVTSFMVWKQMGGQLPKAPSGGEGGGEGGGES